MKRILMFAGGGLGLLLVAALVVPFLVPNQVYKQQIESAATNALGRTVVVEGDVDLSIFPRISASVDGVTIANPDGFSRENTVEAGSLRGDVKWGPLLSRKVEVAQITFVDADVLLERRADGAVNWILGSPGSESEDGDTPPSGGGVDAGIERARLENAQLVYSDAASGARYELTELDLSASLQSLGAPLSADLNGLFQGAPFEVELFLNAPQNVLDGTDAALDIALDTDGGSVTYEGSANLSDEIVLNGAFSVEGRNLTQLAALAGVDVPVTLAALGTLSAEGQISGPLETANITFDTFSLGGNGLDGTYTGAVTLGDTPTLHGRLEMDSRNLGNWIGELGFDLPASASILEQTELDTQLSGPITALNLKSTSLSHDSDLLAVQFDGAATLGDDSRVNGQLDASSTQLRALLSLLEVEMDAGDTLRQFSVKGDVDGTLSRIGVTGLQAQLDDIDASGDLTLDLAGPRPALSGALVTGELDLSPFLTQGEAGPQQNAVGWSDAPLDLSGLKAVDTDVSLTAQKITLGDIILGRPDLAARLQDGDFTATIETMEAFGGSWDGTFTLDASAAEAVLDIDLTGEAIQISDALLSLAGLDALTGVGQLRVDLDSRGNSIKALVEGLDGEMGSDIANGAIKGINVGQLVRSRDTLLESLANGSLQMALAPEAETDFTSLLAGLTVNNGVARLESFKLDNPVVSLEGSGTINLASRTLDVGIVPRVDTSGQGGGSALQLNGIPIPFRIQGDWLSPGLTPDTQLIQSILLQEAEAEARAALQDQVGEELGGLLGDVLGTQRSQQTTPTTPADPAQPAAPVQPDPAEAQDPEDLVEELAREAARDALGSIFGPRRQPDPEDTPPAEPNE